VAEKREEILLHARRLPVGISAEFKIAGGKVMRIAGTNYQRPQAAMSSTEQKYWDANPVLTTKLLEQLKRYASIKNTEEVGDFEAPCNAAVINR
jgi:hypothetical protein